MPNLKITIVSSQNSWLNKHIQGFIDELKGCQVIWVHEVQEIGEGNIAFFLGFEEIVNKEALDKHKNNLVVHESDLPKGKGMSPMTWQILEGKNEISITLFEMEEKLYSGNVYLQDIMGFNGLELVSEIRDKQAEYTFNLCKKFLDSYPEILGSGKVQEGAESFYKGRNPEDSQLDFNKTIAEQFNLLRVVDNDKYPAFFEHQGEKYFLKITK